MSVTRYQSKIRYYREVIQATSTTHNRVRFKNLAGQSIITPNAVVTASSNPTSGNLNNLLSATGETCVFGANKLVTITVDLGQIYDVNAIEVRHATSGTFDKVLVQASTDGVSWYTLYDTTLDGTYAEATSGVLFNSSYEIDVNDRSQIILDVEDNAPFDPKQMIWDNDEKLMEYFESLVERAQHYILNQTSTNKALVLESLTGLYPVNYFESMMVYWVHRTTADSINDATIKVGNLVAKPLIQQGQETITLTEGEPYIAIYDISLGKFKLLSGGGSGLAGKIDTVQATNNFSKYDLGAFDKATGTFVSPDLNLENPILAEAILLPKSYGFEGYINGMVEIPGMLDVDGNAIESGEVYFVSQTNNKKVTKVQPEGGLVQPFMQTYMSRGKLYAMLMQTDSFYGDSGTVWTSGRGFRTNGNVLELDAVDGEVRTDSPRFEVAVTEKDLVSYTGRSVDTIEDLKKVKHAKLGDVVFVSGFHTKGDGSHHKRIARAEDDGSGEQGQNGIWWCIVHSGEVNVSWFGVKGDGVTDDSTYFYKAVNSGIKNISMDFIITLNNSVTISKNLTLKGEGGFLVTKTTAYITIRDVTNFEVRDIKYIGEGGVGFLIHNSSSVKFNNVKFKYGNQRIYLGTCENITVDGCLFEECGYQIIQRVGDVSNNCKVINCTSIKCKNDFVELNCERHAPSHNWLISNNSVYKLGKFNDDGTPVPSTECRFVGITCVDNVIISNNTVEETCGDSAVHLEGMGHYTIVNNTFINCVGTFAKFIWLLPKIYTADPTNPFIGKDNETEYVIKNNHFMCDSEHNLGSNIFIRTIDQADSIRTIIDSNFFVSSKTNYPLELETVKKFTAISMGEDYGRNTIISKNSFVGFDFSILTGTMTEYDMTITENIFNSCSKGIIVGSFSKDIPVKNISKNTFREVEMPIEITNSNVETNIFENIFTNCGVVNLEKNVFKKNKNNIFTNTNYKNCNNRIIVNKESTKDVFLLRDGLINGFLSITLERASNASINRKITYFISKRFGETFSLKEANVDNRNFDRTVTIKQDVNDKNILLLDLGDSSSPDDTWVRVEYFGI